MQTVDLYLIDGDRRISNGGVYAMQGNTGSYICLCLKGSNQPSLFSAPTVNTTPDITTDVHGHIINDTANK